jgi:hypothetical protein
MKVEMLKQTPYMGVYRKIGEVHDILDGAGGGDVTAQRWIQKGIAKVPSEVHAKKGRLDQ